MPSVEELLHHVRSPLQKQTLTDIPRPTMVDTPTPTANTAPIQFQPIYAQPEPTMEAMQPMQAATPPTPTQSLPVEPVAPQPLPVQPQPQPVQPQPQPVQPQPQPVQPQPQPAPQAQKPAAGATHMGSRVGTGSHMSTRTGNTNLGSTRFTQKTTSFGGDALRSQTEAFHAQTEDFKAQHDEPGEYGSENAYRRYPRIPFETEVIMRDDSEYHRFRSIDISEKGVRVKVDDISMFDKGEEITITVRNAPGIGTFSSKGVVMRILRADEGPGYGIFFMHLNPNIRRRITQFVLDQMSARLNRSATRGGTTAA
jgi:outer membrane biosynthesis protein TonB